METAAVGRNLDLDRKRIWSRRIDNRYVTKYQNDNVILSIENRDIRLVGAKLKVSISLFGQNPVSTSTMSEWIQKICLASSDCIDTIWFPERHGGPEDVDHVQPLINMSYMAGCMNKRSSLTPGAGSLIPSLHGRQELIDQIRQVDSLSSNGARVALGLGWDRHQFSRHDFLFDQRQLALDQLAEELKEYATFTHSRNLLRTISGDISQWGKAGKTALGVYTAAFGKSMRMISKNTLDYRRELINSPHRNDSGWVACMTHFCIGNTDRAAAMDYETLFRPYLARHGVRSGVGRENQSQIIDSSIRRMCESMGLIGSEITIKSRIEEYRKAGVDEIVLLFQYGDDLESELEQLRRLCEVVSDG
ncbi:hypothetical protein ACDL65_12510 [Corynebacterium belfantii]|uniref:hypothetical protein n=1 Tax=Corynebacterium belfantii TaxID=2014537 RepID=UPI003530D408